MFYEKTEIIFNLEDLYMLKYVILLLGFLLLIKGADLFVEGSSSVAKLLKIPSIIIGLTIVAFGTSMPEASVSISAALAGKNELSFSNVIGSNIFNLLVVAGMSAVLKPIRVQKSVLKLDFPLSILIAVILLIMSIPKNYHGERLSIITQWNGIVLLVIFIIYLIYTVRQALKARNSNSEPVGHYKILSPLKTAVYIILGIGGIILGGQWVVDSASEIAADFGLSETLIGLTIVALGTSLPELVTSIVAARKGESDLALGNVVGSNIFNILLVLGASSALHPVAVNLFSIYDTIFLVVSSIIVYLLALRREDINKKEGFLMLPLYALFFVFILVR